MPDWKDPVRVPWPTVTQVRDEWAALIEVCIDRLHMSDQQLGEMLYPPAEHPASHGAAARRVVAILKARRSYGRYFP